MKEFNDDMEQIIKLFIQKSGKFNEYRFDFQILNGSLTDKYDVVIKKR